MLLAIGIGLGYYLFGRRSPEPEIITETQIVRDTVVELRKPDPIVIEKVKTKIVEKRDTILMTRPFTAFIDTVFRRDTIYASFDFPERRMSLRVTSGADSFSYIRNNLIKTVHKPRPWWETPAMVSGGAVLGTIITLMIK
jgi:hypothetical protein